MKHIKKFEELNWDTYYNAGEKLKGMAKKPGGKSWERDKDNVQYKRGAEIHKWGYTREYKDLGTLTLHSKDGVREGMLSSISIDPGTFYEGFIYEPDRPETGHITLFVQVYDSKIEDTDNLFYICVPLKWIDNNTKFIVDGEIIVDNDMIDLKDRQSAVKVRKAIQIGNWITDLNPNKDDENYDEDMDIKHQFMLYSDGDEYEKMINAFKNVSINLLYK